MISVFGQRAGDMAPETNIPDDTHDEEQVDQDRMAEIKAFRKRMRITIKGNDVPNPIERFDQIPAPPAGSTLRLQYPWSTNPLITRAPTPYASCAHVYLSFGYFF